MMGYLMPSNSVSLVFNIKFFLLYFIKIIAFFQQKNRPRQVLSQEYMKKIFTCQTVCLRYDNLALDKDGCEKYNNLNLIKLDG